MPPTGTEMEARPFGLAPIAAAPMRCPLHWLHKGGNLNFILFSPPSNKEVMMNCA